MKKIVLILACAFTLASCTDEKSARKTLINAGYYPISVGGYGFFECSEDDVYATRFKAYSQDSSTIISGCVCEGLFKGKTIRFD